MRISIERVKELAKACGLSHCVVYGWDGKQQHVATWGKTIEQCSEAADFGNKLKTALGWPESLHSQPSRVRRLQARNKELESVLCNIKVERVQL